jgi:pyruvate kinase
MALPISKDAAEAFRSGVSVGARVLFDDGRIIASVKKILPSEVVIEIESGGKLTSNKGINLPGAPLKIPCLTAKDLSDLKFGIDQKVDAIALSFVRSPDDVLKLRDEIKKVSNFTPMIISKIELDEAVLRKDEIIEVSEGLLIARGDMAVELGAERVPVIQKELIKSCNQLGVPVITATQMLESMILSPTPTRAEASDVANAVFDGTDAVMLSGETANGQYPVEAVSTMSRIVLEAERYLRENPNFQPHEPLPVMGSVVDAIERSAAAIAEQLGATAIACLTHSGMAARTLARYRPDPPIVAILDNPEMMRRLCFVWGVQTVGIEKIVATDDLFSMVENVLMQNGHARLGDSIVVTAGIPTLRRGTTNMIKVHRIGARHERR